MLEIACMLYNLAIIGITCYMRANQLLDLL